MAAITGDFTATGRSASFTPRQQIAFNVTIYGTFSAEIRLERSFDGGTTWFVVSQNCNEYARYLGSVSEQRTETEFGVIYSLNCVSYTSGTASYRLSQ